jgi:hypothetical protein
MKLIESYDELFSLFKPHFHRIDTFNRARDLAYAHLVTLGRHTISRLICGKNEQQQDWSADYKFFSQRKWDANDFYFEILKECDAHSHWYQDAIVLAMDESFRKKTGKKIPQVRTLRDPMSLPYHTNLMPAIRFLQASAIINPHNRIEVSRAIPVFFEEAAPAKKPRKNAPTEIQQQYKKEQKEKRISVVAHQSLLQIRQQIDQLPDGKNRLLFTTVDGSFCNRYFLRDVPENIIVIARARKDMKLFKPVENSTSTEKGGRYRIYGERLPTPEQIRKDDFYPWKTARVFAAGKYHDVRYKVISPVLWQKGTGRQRCRLFIIAPLRYRTSKNSRLLYRDPAYLLVLDEEVPEEYILQYYCLRWDIEVNNRDEKSLMGLGDAQVRSPESVERNPQFTVAVYSLLLLASIKAYGPFRTDDYLPAPKWHKRKEQNDRRPSTLDILSQFRREIMIAQLEQDLEQETKNMRKNKKQKRHKRPASLIEARKRGFINDQSSGQKPLKLPVNILAALLYADS